MNSKNEKWLLFPGAKHTYYMYANRKIILAYVVHLIKCYYKGDDLMAVFKNQTQRNFTVISNNILKDKELSMKDRGVFCTLCSLPDGWNFSIRGIAALVKDGRDAIQKSVRTLETLGYMRRTLSRNSNGRFETVIELYLERQPVEDTP